MTPAVFLDRDGTMIHDVGYLKRVEELRWFPSTIDAVRLLNRAGFLVCVTTNQGGIGLGYYGDDVVHIVHAHMAARIERAGGRIDAWFHCPHHPRAVVEGLGVACECRKPAPGMVRQACARFDIDLPRSFVIGDKLLDVEVAARTGARGILVRTGYGEETVRAHNGAVPGAAFVSTDLMAATSWLLMESGHPGGAS